MNIKNLTKSDSSGQYSCDIFIPSEGWVKYATFSAHSPLKPTVYSNLFNVASRSEVQHHAQL